MRYVKLFFSCIFNPNTPKLRDFRMESAHINSMLVGDARNPGYNEKPIQSFGGDFFSLLYATGGTN